MYELRDFFMLVWSLRFYSFSLQMLNIMVEYYLKYRWIWFDKEVDWMCIWEIYLESFLILAFNSDYKMILKTNDKKRSKWLRININLRVHEWNISYLLYYLRWVS